MKRELSCVVQGFQPPLTHAEGLAETHSISTMSHMIEYKKPVPRDLEWVLIRTNTHVCRNGRYDIDVFMLDPQGEIIAICRQVVQAREYKQRAKPKEKTAKI